VYPSTMRIKRRFPLSFRIALVLACAFGIAALVFMSHASANRIELWLYDAYLGLGPSTRLPAVLVLPEAGKGTLSLSDEESRATFRLLGELGVKRVSLAGSVLEPLSSGDRLSALQAELPGLVDRECGTVEENVRALYEAIRSGSLPPKDLGRDVDLLVDTIHASGERIKEAAVSGGAGSSASFEEPFAPPIVAAGSFIGSKPDSDGVLRSILLVKVEKGSLVPSYELSSLMAYLGAPKLELKPGRLVLSGCSFPGGASGELSIPVDSEARALLGRTRKGSGGESQRLDLAMLRGMISEEAELLARVEELDAEGFLEGQGLVLLSRYRRTELLRASAVAGAAVGDWKEARKDFFSAAADYFETASAPESASAPFEDCRRLARSLVSERAALAQKLEGSFVYLAMDEEHIAPALAGTAFAAQALSGRIPSVSFASFRWALVLILVFLALVCALIALLTKGQRPTSREPGQEQSSE
jgi:hypothetical protein